MPRPPLNPPSNAHAWQTAEAWVSSPDKSPRKAAGGLVSPVAGEYPSQWRLRMGCKEEAGKISVDWNTSVGCMSSSADGMSSSGVDCKSSSGVDCKSSGVDCKSSGMDCKSSGAAHKSSSVDFKGSADCKSRADRKGSADFSRRAFAESAGCGSRSPDCRRLSTVSGEFLQSPRQCHPAQGYTSEKSRISFAKSSLPPTPSEWGGDSSGSIVGRASVASIVSAMSTIVDETNPEMIRAVRLSTVMSGMGSAFQSNEGGNARFEESKPVEEMDDFLSHNWSTPRWQKFFALSLHYQQFPAIVVMYLTSCVAAVMVWAGWLPVFPTSFTYNVSGTNSFHCLIVGYLSFTAVICFGNTFRWIFRVGDRLVFLDKLCIHQKNEVLKLTAIRGLATFLKHAERMVVVYSDLYLQKLWTIYEVAAFLALHGESRSIIMCQARKAQRIFVCASLLTVETILSQGAGILNRDPSAHFLSDERMVFTFHFSFILAMYVVLVRSWLRDVHSMRLAIEDFGIRGAMCAVETDRNLVESNICVLMKFIEKVPVEADLDTTLDAFDSMVQQKLPEALVQSFGRNLLDYGTVVVTTAGMFLLHLDKASARAAAGMPWSYVLISVMEGLCLNLGFSPIVSWLMTNTLSNHMHLNGWAEICHIMFRAIVLVAPISFLLYLPLTAGEFLVEAQALPRTACAIVGGYSFVIIPLSMWLHRPLPHAPVDAVPGGLEYPMDFCTVQSGDISPA